MPTPEPGQLVQVRGRYFLVQDVNIQTNDDNQVSTKVTLECLDDDWLGEQLDLFWELEPENRYQIRDSLSLPEPKGKWDSPERFKAFLLALKWSSSSVVEGLEISAPFRSAIEIEDYQLEPLSRAMLMPRINLLIADDVGLGKTIEAGLVLQEMISRQRARRCLIVTPASLQNQWKEEMKSKFELDFHIIDRAAIQKLRKEYGIHVNPFESFPRLITSMDFIKREEPTRLFDDCLHFKETSILRDWDFLIVDEVHNVAPSGRKNYIKDSDRTKMMRHIVNNFENRLFLTATPHNGYTESFTALLEILDPLRFSRGRNLDKNQLDKIMVRRLKDEIEDAWGDRKFTKRIVDHLPPIEPTENERALHETLKRYTKSRLSVTRDLETLPVQFTLTLLKKRLLSSPRSFYKSILKHLETTGADREGDVEIVKRRYMKSLEEWDNDYEKDENEETGIEEATLFFKNLTPQEITDLKSMKETSEKLEKSIDTKMKELMKFIDNNLRPDGTWNKERLLIFTEYRDTLYYIREFLEKNGIKEDNELLILFGGMSLEDRELIKSKFQESPEDNNVRILLATDAASEGLNLQNYCRYLIHYEIPWNPNKMEQRNGRIDRHGQKAPEVFIYHFIHKDDEDFKFLSTLVQKVQQQRHDLGSVSDIIAQQVEKRMIGLLDITEVDVTAPKEKKDRVKEDIKYQKTTKEDLKKLMDSLNKSKKELRLTSDNQKIVLDQALKLINNNGLEYNENLDSFVLSEFPQVWNEYKRSIFDTKGRKLNLIFDHEKARNRKDVALVHLNHPLMKLSMSLFRKNMWSEGLSGEPELARITIIGYKKSFLSYPIVVGFGRIVVVGKFGNRLHEDIILTGGRFEKGNVEFIESNELENILYSDQGFGPKIKTELGEKIRKFYSEHKQFLEGQFNTLQKSEEKRLKDLLQQRAKTESEELKKMIEERMDEIRKILKTEKEQFIQTKLTDYSSDEKEQYQDDIKWLEKKLEQHKKDLIEEPKKAFEKYEISSIRIFPIGLAYLLPEDLVKVGE